MMILGKLTIFRPINRAGERKVLICQILGLSRTDAIPVKVALFEEVSVALKVVTAFVRTAITVAVLSSVSGCALPGFGPTRSEVTAGAKPTTSGEVRYALVDIDPGMAATMEKWEAVSLRGTFGNRQPQPRQTI